MAAFQKLHYSRWAISTSRVLSGAREMACFFFWGRGRHANGLLPGEAGSSVWARTCSSLRRLARVAFRALELYAAAQLVRVARFAC